MKQLTIDTGVEEFSVNGRACCASTPPTPTSTTGFLMRARPSRPWTKSWRRRPPPCREGDAGTEAGLALLADYDGRIKALLTDIFGAENDFDKVLGGVNLAGVGANGKRVVQNLLEALTPIPAGGRPAASGGHRRHRRGPGRRQPAPPGAGYDRVLGPAHAGGHRGPGLRDPHRFPGHSGAAALAGRQRRPPRLDRGERWYVAMRLFYPDFAAMPRQDWPAATRFLTEFLAAGRPEPAAGTPRLMDWQQDAPLIAAGISRVAGQDVRALPYLHWWSFLGWFDAIGEGTFATVVAIRDKLRRGQEAGALGTGFLPHPPRRRGPAPRPRPGGRRRKAAAAGAAGRLTPPKGGT